MKSLDAHLHEFKTEGYTIFPKILDDTWVQQMRDAFHEIVERIPTPDEVNPPTSSTLSSTSQNSPCQPSQFRSFLISQRCSSGPTFN